MTGDAKVSDASATMDFARRDAADKLRGRTRYTIDRYLPGMLHAAILRAGVPSGRIARLDTSKASRMPGVRAIVTAADAPGMIGIGIADHPLFARDVIRYDGEPIAAIAADTLMQAQAALAADRCRDRTVARGSHHGGCACSGRSARASRLARLRGPARGGAREGNVAWEATVVRGDVDAAFARPDVVIIESCFRVGRQNHVAFEPRAVVASYEDGRFHIETSTQVPGPSAMQPRACWASRRPRFASPCRRSAAVSASNSISRSSPLRPCLRGRADGRSGSSIRAKKRC